MNAKVERKFLWVRRKIVTSRKSPFYSRTHDESHENDEHLRNAQLPYAEEIKGTEKKKIKITKTFTPLWIDGVSEILQCTPGSINKKAVVSKNACFLSEK